MFLLFSPCLKFSQPPPVSDCPFLVATTKQFFLTIFRLAWEEDSNVSFGDEEVSRCKYLEIYKHRGVTRGGWWCIGGGVYSYIRVLPDDFLLKSVVFKSFQRKLFGQNTNI